MYVAVFGFLEKQQLSSGWRAQFLSEQSSRRQKQGSNTGPQHGPCKWGVRIQPSAYGSAARAVQERSGSARVSCTDRVRDIGLARVLSTGRIREACRTYLPHTGRAAQHGPCCSFGLHGSQKGLARGVFVILATRGMQIDTGRPWICTGHVILFFWGRKPNLFSVFRVYYDLRILIGLISESY